MLVKRNESKEFEVLEAGIYDAVCYQVIDLGTQKTAYVDERGNQISSRKMRIGFELVDNLMSDGRPFVVSKEYTASLHEKSILLKDLTSWRGKEFTKEELSGFEMSNILKIPCQLQIIQKTNEKTNKTYSVIQNVLPKNKHFKFEKLHNEIIDFDLEKFDAVIFEKVYDFLKEKIKLSQEYQALNLK